MNNPNPHNWEEILTLVLLFYVYYLKGVILRAERKLGLALKVNALCVAVLWAYAIYIRFNPPIPMLLQAIKFSLITSCVWVIVLLVKQGYTHWREHPDPFFILKLFAPFGVFLLLWLIFIFL